MPADGDWLTTNWHKLLPLLLGFAAIWWLMPQGKRRPPIVGMIAGLAALVWGGFVLLHVGDNLLVHGLFCLFAAVAIGAAVCMITSSNPVYAALWFALVTLSSCGLYLLSSAPFLAASTIIVYAGAIIVTFLFVIMLARQSGALAYDQRTRDPLLAIGATALLACGLIMAIAQWGEDLAARQAADERGDAVASVISRTGFVKPPEHVRANTLSQPAADEELGTLRSLGRSLFGDYLYAIEVAGTLLMVATIGAICIAPRRARGTL